MTMDCRSASRPLHLASRPMRRWLVVLFLLAGCSSSKPAADKPTSTSVDEAGAEAALRVQLQELADGQFGRMYDLLHPAQQAVLSRDKFVACYVNGPSIGAVSDIKVKDHFSETTSIPGTDQHAESTAITASFKVDGQADTSTFHEVNVNGAWRWIYSDAPACIAGA